MMSGQDQFRAALLDPGLPVPQGLQDAQGRPAGKRFDVYRNNVVVGLIEALATAFPVIEKLLGAENFRVLAGAYVRAYPPRSALMMFYGDHLPAFLQGFEPVADLGYLPDVARLELAIRRCYHAADAIPVNPQSLNGLTPDRLMKTRFRFAPAVDIVRSDWPVHAIWRFNMQNGEKPRMQAEDVLLMRPEFDPVQVLLPPGGASFIAALQTQHTLAEALDMAAESDLTSLLMQLFTGRALIEINPGGNS